MKNNILLTTLFTIAIPYAIESSYEMRQEPIEFMQEELDINIIPFELENREFFAEKSAYIQTIITNESTPSIVKLLQIEKIALYLKNQLSVHGGYLSDNDPEFARWIRSELTTLSYVINKLDQATTSKSLAQRAIESHLIYQIKLNLFNIGLNTMYLASKYTLNQIS